MKGFLTFVREQGVVGLAVGFILGGAVSKVVAALVSDVINPILGIILGAAKGMETASFKIGPASILWGHFLSVIVDFLVVALVVYFGVKKLGLDKINHKKK
jgi:large conductance mechanosensitive channel